MKLLTPWIVAIGIFLVAPFILLGLVSILPCKPYKYVVEIGACNRYGYCGVKYSDGSFDRKSLPVIGQEECSK
jgi:hypothetical protein